MKTRVILLAAMMIIGASSFAKNTVKSQNKSAAKNTMASVSGTITDELTGESLAGVKVVLEGTDKVTYTDFDGMFSFEGVAQGTYTVKVDYISYQDVAQIIDTERTKDLDVQLKTDK